MPTQILNCKPKRIPEHWIHKIFDSFDLFQILFPFIQSNTSYTNFRVLLPVTWYLYLPLINFLQSCPVHWIKLNEYDQWRKKILNNRIAILTGDWKYFNYSAVNKLLFVISIFYHIPLQSVSNSVHVCSRSFCSKRTFNEDSSFYSYPFFTMISSPGFICIFKIPFSLLNEYFFEISFI